MNVFARQNLSQSLRAGVVLITVIVPALAFGQTPSPECRRVMTQLYATQAKVAAIARSYQMLRIREQREGLPRNIDARCQILDRIDGKEAIFEQLVK